MGEHAVVYGRPALVAAVDPRARVEVDEAAAGIAVELIDFGRCLETTWQEARERATVARRAWERYVADPTPENFAAIDARSPEALTQVALGELANVLENRPLPPLRLRVSSGLPVGSGFGSSAAIAVALIGGVLTRLEGRADPELVDALALEVERRQHGLPSGVDHKTVLFGGVIQATRRLDGELQIARLERRSPRLETLAVYQTGEPAETTGEVVAEVRRRRDENPGEVDALLDRMGVAVEVFRDELESAGEPTSRFVDQIVEYQRCLEELGVVPRPVRETIRRVEACGGAAKISGAGALTGASAGCLLVHWPEGPPAVLPPRLDEYSRQAVALGAQGLRVEEDR